MIVTDVNPLVYAFRSEMPLHSQAREALDEARHEGSLVVLSEVAIGFVRLTTNGKVFRAPDSIDEALGFLRAVTANSSGVREAPYGRWDKFSNIAANMALKTSDVHDALLAAACIELGAEILTSDRGFTQYPDLRVRLIVPGSAGRKGNG